MTVQSQAAERVAVRRAARRAGILAEREAAKPAPPDTIWDSMPLLAPRISGETHDPVKHRGSGVEIRPASDVTAQAATDTVGAALSPKSAVCLHDAHQIRRYAVVRGAADPNLEGLRTVFLGTAAEAQTLAAEWLASEPVLVGARIEMEACPKCAS